MAKPLTVIAVIFAATLALTGCYNAGAAGGCAELPPAGWAYGDTLRFGIERLDSLRPATLSVWVRNNNAYPYNNLWLEVSYHDGSRQRRDTVNVRLADVYGRWTGRGFGHDYQTEAVVAEGVAIANGADVKVRHVMRVDTVRGLEQVGVTLE